MTFQEVLLIRICTVNARDKVGVEKYLRKNCYHRIECSAANSMAIFIWRRPLNSVALVAPTHREPMRVFDGTSINTSNLMSTWKVEMREEMWYKIGGKS